MRKRTAALLARLLAMFIPKEKLVAQDDSEIPRVPGAPDFTDVRSTEDAKVLVESGRLVRVLLFPEEVGGEDIDLNAAYLPPEAAAAKSQIDGTILRFVHEGAVNQMRVAPVYRGESVVPARIVMHVWHSEKDGSLEPTIDVW